MLHLRQKSWWISLQCPLMSRLAPLNIAQYRKLVSFIGLQCTLRNTYLFSGCKGFFRRTILQNAEYVCRTSRGGCDLKAVDHARQRCQKCRIERCYEVRTVFWHSHGRHNQSAVKMSHSTSQKWYIVYKSIQAGMLEKYVRRKKNRTRTMRILENMKRPTVIVESLTATQSQMLKDVINTWNHVTGAYILID